MKILLLALGGATGTLLRYFMAELTYKFTSGIFPWGTVAVNLIGSLIIGLLWGILDIDHLSPYVKNLVFIGILGSFTTFSTYSLDTMNLIRMGEIKSAVTYVLISNIFGIGMAVVGFLIGRQAA